ncbi:MAG: response regulator [Gallionella sp.]|jgi:DNA-binding NtrC family response regulator
MKRILLVDDEPSVLNALRRELNDRYEIETFDDPVAALERCRKAQFDLVVADYKMPGTNGIEFLREFGQMQPNASRIVLSGNSDIDTLIRMINETHIYRFLSKPWKTDELLSSIRQALEYRDAILDNHHQADARRQSNTDVQMIPSDSPFRIVLVDSDDHLLKLMSRELADVNGHESLYRTIQQEIKQETPLSKFKFIINIFHGAQAALAHAKSNSFDLIISAQILPDMEGIKLLGKVQHILPDTALILLSDNTDKSVLMQAIDEADVRNLVLLHWANSELRSDARRQAWNLHQLRTAAIQALASR